ncbi:MAG: hypothetical protein R3B06_30915 [Kofleriaceae bacterium]
MAASVGGLAAGCGRADDGGRARCLAARDAGKWPTAVEVCRGPLADYGKLGQAWAAFDRGDNDGALVLLPPLYDGPAGPDAKYLAGFLIGRGQVGDHERARPLFQQALAGFQAEGVTPRRHAPRTTSRVPRPEALFDDGLAMARLAVEEAHLSQRDEIIGRAETALAEIYDDIGMEDEARAAFLRAEAHLGAHPDMLAYTYLKHGRFLVNLGTKEDLESALSFFDAAQGQVERATREGIPASASSVVKESIPTNRAIVYAYLGDAVTAQRLSMMRRGKESSADMTMLRGYIAAPPETWTRQRVDRTERSRIRHGRLPMASFVNLREPTIERGGLPRQCSYRRAIDDIEQLRVQALHAELRPWVLARRTAPYEGLVDLLARHGQGGEALVIAKPFMHERGWIGRCFPTWRRSPASVCVARD